MKKIFRSRTFWLFFSLWPTCFLFGCSTPENSDTTSNRINNDQPAIIVSASESDAAEPVVASAPDGSVYVVWVEHLPEKRADVYIRRFDAEQNPLGEPVRVNPEAGRATAWRGDPPTVKIGADGTAYIGWTTRVPVAAGGATDLYLSVSRDGGKTFDAPVRVNDDSVPASHGMHSLEVDQAGSVYFAWLDERYLKNGTPDRPMNMMETGSGEMKHQHAEPNGEVYFAVSQDDGKSFSANKKIAGNACPCCKVSLAAAPDGRLYVAWRQVLDGDFRHMAVSSSIDGGKNFAPLTVVSDDRWQISACPVSGAGLSVDSGNNLQVVWYTAGEAGIPGIYKAASKDGGQTFAPRVLVSGEAAGGTPLIVKDAKNNARIVYSTIDKNTRLLEAIDGSADFTAEDEIADADLPGVALSKDKLFIAFVRIMNEKRKVFLTKRN